MHKTDSKNTRIIFSLFMMTSISQMALVLYTPAFSAIALNLNLNPSAVQVSLTSYLLGFGLSQLFYGPLSDCFGRKKPLLIGMLILALSCLWTIFASGFWSLLLSRFSQGLGVGAAVTLSRAILSDHFTGKEYTRVASYLSSGFAFGLGVSPVISGHLLDFFPWRSSFVFLFIISLLLLLLFSLWLPETKTQNRAKLSLAFISQTRDNMYQILKNLQFIGYLVGGTMAYGVVISYNTLAPFLFQHGLNLSASLYGWLTFAVALSYYVGASINRKFVGTFGTDLLIKFGLMLIVLSGVGLLLLSLLSAHMTLYGLLIPSIVATFGQALIFSNCIAGALKDFRQIAGTAAALFSCLQMVLAAMVSGFVSLAHALNPIPLATSFIVLAIIAAIFMVKILFIYKAAPITAGKL